MRTFIALDIRNEEVISNVSRIQSMIRGTGVDATYVDHRSLHFTIRFLGETGEDTIARVKSALSDVKARRVTVKYQGIGVFPGRQRINVVWLGVDKNCVDELMSISDGVNKAISRLGFRPEREFQPHATIARIKSGKNREELMAVIDNQQTPVLGEERLENIKLKKSTLTPDGPIYEDLQSISLDD
ncbi:MAG: RNA 2',3'-cyclic phosphodiesterase [Nitrososphaerales archaeon]